MLSQSVSLLSGLVALSEEDERKVEKGEKHLFKNNYSYITLLNI